MSERNSNYRIYDPRFTDDIAAIKRPVIHPGDSIQAPSELVNQEKANQNQYMAQASPRPSPGLSPLLGTSSAAASEPPQKDSWVDMPTNSPEMSGSEHAWVDVPEEKEGVKAEAGIRAAKSYANAASGGLAGLLGKRVEAASKTGNLENMASIANPMAEVPTAVDETSPEYHQALRDSEDEQRKWALENPKTALATHLAGSFGPSSVNAGIGALVGGTLGSTLNNPATDYLMQKAVGANKYLKGMGNKLAAEGLWGTRKGLESQVGSKLGETGGQLESAISDIPGNISPEIPAGKVAQYGENLKAPQGGGVSPQDQKLLEEARLRSEQIGTQGDLHPEDALHFKRRAADNAYNSKIIENGKVKNTPASEMSALEERGYDDALSKAYAKAHPEEANAYDAANARFVPLLFANKSLAKAPTLYKSPMSLQDIGFTTGGGAAGGPLGAALGYAGSKISKTPLFQTSLGQALYQSPKAIPAALRYKLPEGSE